MTTAVQSLLESFDALSAAERKEAAVEILRRATSEGDLPVQARSEAADAQYAAFDAEEAVVDRAFQEIDALAKSLDSAEEWAAFESALAEADRYAKAAMRLEMGLE